MKSKFGSVFGGYILIYLMEITHACIRVNTISLYISCGVQIMLAIERGALLGQSSTLTRDIFPLASFQQRYCMLYLRRT